MGAGRVTGQRGFTLLEAVIALAIMGLAMAALIRGAQSGIRGTLVATHYEEAVSRARSRLAMLEASLQPGVQEGDDGGGYRWRVAVAPADSAAAPARDVHAAVPTLYAVRVSISWTMDGGTREVSLPTWRLGLLAPSGP